MNELILACATNNGIEFVNSHFGDADYFDIYKLSKDGFKKLDRVINSSEEEKEDENTHGDPKKAKSLSKLLKDKKVEVMVGYKMGANILRMKKVFVPVLVREINIEKGLRMVQDNFEKVVKELNKGENREYLNLNK
ncbi:MAG: hypothetical protein PWP46_913 [Fusobacteriaceae bacterium]|jgi:predicted Fe-Mo cluster-binding NifX family protein|nr:Dinitrogenase iron-molybdenum cofactor biosynthesis protein [Fusobacteriales bacterium]MDN5304034.1 hypothetical protein [Fusobacteriaceae bacterium]